MSPASGREPGPPPRRLAHVDAHALAWAIGVAGGDWRRVVARGEGVAVAAAPQTFHTVLPAQRAPARRAPRRVAPAPEAPVETGGWTFTPHALAQMRERAVTLEEALAVLAFPDADSPTIPSSRHLGDERNAQSREVRVTYRPCDRAVLTVARLDGR